MADTKEKVAEPKAKRTRTRKALVDKVLPPELAAIPLPEPAPVVEPPPPPKELTWDDLHNGDLVDVKAERQNITEYSSRQEFSASGVVNYLPVKPAQDSSAYCLIHSPSRAFNLWKQQESVIRTLSPEETKEYEEKMCKAHDLWTYSPSMLTGSDPEVFVLDKNGQVIPAWKFLPKTPQMYHNTGEPLSGYEAFWDGFQAEFVTGPRHCHQEHIESIRKGLASVRDAARKVGGTLTWKSVVDVDPDMMLDIKDEHAALGCAPSLNIYDTPPINVPNSRQLLCRFAGAHMHVGCGNVRPEFVRRMVSSMDRIFGTIMTYCLRGMEDPRRRTYYGRAGEHRLPKHGIEYRVPSSAILAHPVLTFLMFDVWRVSSAAALFRFDGAWECSDEEAQEVLNNYNIDLAAKVIQRNKKMFDRLLGLIYGEGEDKAQDIIMGGAMNCLPLDDMEKNWGFDGTWIPHGTGKNQCVGKYVAKK